MHLRAFLKGIEVIATTGDLEREIEGIACDSRHVEQNFAFVCYQGVNVDGHEYIPNAIDRGATAVISELPLRPSVRPLRGASPPCAGLRLHSLRARTRFFQKIEKDIETEKMDIFKTTGYYPHFSPILRTTDEARKFSRIYLDMTEHVLVIYDEEQFFMQILKDMRNFLSKINAQKKWIGKKWYWVFAPDVEIGEVLPDG